MVDIKINKVFVDPNTGEDLYVLSMLMSGKVQCITVTKKDFEHLFIKLRSIYDNSEMFD